MGKNPAHPACAKKNRNLSPAPIILENFIQSIWIGIGGIAGKVLVLGGDGRAFNVDAVQIILEMAAASGAAKVIVGQNGLFVHPGGRHTLSAFAVAGAGSSCQPAIIRAAMTVISGLKYKHRKWWPPAPESVTNAIFQGQRNGNGIPNI